MVIAFCNCKTELFILDAEEDYVVVELARARIQMKACCLFSLELALQMIRIEADSIRIIEPSQEPNPN